MINFIKDNWQPLLIGLLILFILLGSNKAIKTSTDLYELRKVTDSLNTINDSLYVEKARIKAKIDGVLFINDSLRSALINVLFCKIPG